MKMHCEELALILDERGRLVTINTLFITGGQFVASLVDGVFSSQEDGWKYMLGLGAFPAALQFVGFLLLPGAREAFGTFTKRMMTSTSELPLISDLGVCA